MPSIAFYLKYRPQTLDDLIGQNAVKKILLSSFQNQKLAHAYLFVGPRGTGKTSTARILAKMVNCSAEQDKVPCSKCSVCLSIADGSNLDLIEIDAASNRGIEDIRILRETIKLSPTGAGKKVYIIDEVHMLTTEAFNALLKTLEEPPSHALFILATTEVAKIPQTIQSRVQRLDFSLASNLQLHEALEKIAKAEQIEIDPEALEIIIKKSEGSFRDAVKFLDQFGNLGKKITAEDLRKTLKASRLEDLISLLQSMNTGKSDASILTITQMLEDGLQVKDLILSLMEITRDLMLIKNDLGEQLVEPKFTFDKYAMLKQIEPDFTIKGLTSKLNILQEALTKLKYASILSLPLELAVIEICAEKAADPTPAAVEKPASIIDQPSSGDDILKLKEKWNFVLETVRPSNFSLEALLRSVKIAHCDEKSVVIEVPYTFHQRILEAPKNRELLESILSDILGRIIKVTTALGDRPARREDIANVEVAADDEIIRVAAEIFNSDPVN